MTDTAQHHHVTLTVRLHQVNILSIVMGLGACMAAPPSTVVRTVFASA